MLIARTFEEHCTAIPELLRRYITRSTLHCLPRKQQKYNRNTTGCERKKGGKKKTKNPKP
jgi:hypothetical protein